MRNNRLVEGFFRRAKRTAHVVITGRDNPEWAVNLRPIKWRCTRERSRKNGLMDAVDPFIRARKRIPAPINFLGCRWLSCVIKSSRTSHCDCGIKLRTTPRCCRITFFRRLIAISNIRLSKRGFFSRQIEVVVVNNACVTHFYFQSSRQLTQPQSWRLKLWECVNKIDWKYAFQILQRYF